MAKAHAVPKFLPEDQKKKWQGTYDATLKQAKANPSNSDSQAHAAALKEANKLLAVPTPTSAADIEKLEAWQVVKRGPRLIDGKEHLSCITIDGKKFAFPVAAKNAV
jgi:hypothetical protein